MAWTAPRTWVTAEVVTAALMNTHVRDNLSFLGTILAAGSGPTASSVLYGGGSSALGEVALSAGRGVIGNASSVPVAVHLMTAFDGFLRHEVGGLEASIAAAAKGSLISFASSGGGGAVLSVGSNGQVLTADSSETLGIRWAPLVALAAYKTTSETYEETTLQNDDELVVAVEANKKYYFRLFIAVDSTVGTVDIKVGWSVPSGTGIQWCEIGEVGADGIALLTQANTAVCTSITSTDIAWLLEGIVTVGGTAGNFQMQWAQNTDAGITRVLAGSSLILFDLT